MNRKQKRAQRARHPKLKPSKRQRKQVLTLTAEGKNRELVATETGVSIAKLRTDYARELDVGRKLAADKKADEAEAAALTMAQFHFLDVAADSFASHWFDETDGRNLLFRGVDGKGAKDLADAYAFWASKGERYNTTGLSTKFDPVRAARFAEIVNDYRNKFETR